MAEAILTLSQALDRAMAGEPIAPVCQIRWIDARQPHVRAKSEDKQISLTDPDARSMFALAGLEAAQQNSVAAGASARGGDM
jgi:hypothetical protein